MTQTKGASITEPCSLWACITLTLRSIITEFSCFLSNMIIPLYWNYPMIFVLNVIGNWVCSQNPVPFGGGTQPQISDFRCSLRKQPSFFAPGPSSLLSCLVSRIAVYFQLLVVFDSPCGLAKIYWKTRLNSITYLFAFCKQWFPHKRPSTALMYKRWVWTLENWKEPVKRYHNFVLKVRLKFIFIPRGITSKTKLTVLSPKRKVDHSRHFCTAERPSPDSRSNTSVYPIGQDGPLY